MVHSLAAVEPLGESGVFARIFDGQPWLITAVILLAGLAGWAVLRGQGRPGRARIAALIAIAAALALNIAARVVVTARERLSAATLELVRATAKADTAALGPMLAEDCVAVTRANMAGVPIPREGLGKEAILTTVASMLGGPYTLKEYAVIETQAQTTGATSGRSQVRVRTTPESMPAPVFSWWRVDWRKTPDGDWKAVLIEPLELGGSTF